MAEKGTATMVQVDIEARLMARRIEREMANRRAERRGIFAIRRERPAADCRPEGGLLRVLRLRPADC
jgi:hypothetical protein